jgi:hypothetical protein
MEHPFLYEINTRCWLRALSDAAETPVTLADIPELEFEFWKKSGFTHIWLMGIWATGPICREMAIKEPNLRSAYDFIIPGWTEQDIGGSPYAIGDYSVPAAIGGEAGLKKFREKLHAHGLKLILDFVPNHLGLDHRWLRERPELFVQSPEEVPGTFRQETIHGIRWLAHGKDPYFAPWCDTVQIDYRRDETRAAMKELLLSVAAQCDGVRCDMAMLLLNDVFEKTWSHMPTIESLESGVLCPESPMPPTEFWTEVIPAVKKLQPHFIFLAEVYWDLEGRMQELGFDFTYDKRLYDELYWRNGRGAASRVLWLPRDILARSAHFIENHDEWRIANQLLPAEQRAVALVIFGLPGMRFLHEGQLTGAKVKLPVQLSRRGIEPMDAQVKKIYDELLPMLQHSAVGRGEWRVLLARESWPDNATAQNFVIVEWQSEPPAFDLVVVNLAAQRSQCYASLSVPGLAEYNWELHDLLGDERYERFGADLATQGLYLDLPEWGAQLFHFEPLR